MSADQASIPDDVAARLAALRTALPAARGGAASAGFEADLAWLREALDRGFVSARRAARELGVTLEDMGEMFEARRMENPVCGL